MRRTLPLTAASLLAAVLIAAVLVSSFAFRARQHRLAEDWRQLQSAAPALGFGLAGSPSGSGGWPLSAFLDIDRPRLLPAGGTDPAKPVLWADSLRLGRAALDPATLSLHPTGLSIHTGSGGIARLWADAITEVESSRGVRTLRVRDGRAALGHGPDDVASVRAVTVSLRAGTGGTLLILDIDRPTLPLSTVRGADRSIRHADLRILLTGPPGGRVVDLKGADLLWGDLDAHLTGRLAADPAGTLSGRLSLSLAPGWQRAIGRAAADGLITPSVARAAAGLLALLSPGPDARDLPIAVERGRVTLGGLLLFTLPNLPSPAITMEP